MSWFLLKIFITMAPMSGNHTIVLASKSPRRRAMFEGLGIDFRVLPSLAEERRLEGETPVAYAKRAALEKGMEVCI